MNRKVRTSPKMTEKLKMKNIFVYVAWAIGAVCAGGFAFLYFNLGNLEDAFAAGSTYSSTKTGSWSVNSTWVSGAAPATSGLNGDNITINGPHTVNAGSISTDNNVTITIQSGATLYIAGNLIVKNSLILNNSGKLVITGKLEAKNGAKITISGGGSAQISGDASFDQNATLVVNGTMNIGGSISFGNNESFSGTGTVTIGGGCVSWSGPGLCSNGTLPVKLLSFTAENANSVVKIDWQTAMEENNEFFTIERTSDGVTYTPIATIPGAGTTLKKSDYSYEDHSPLTGTSYYRLKQTDYDGKTETFPHVTVTRSSKGASGFTVFPNPLKGVILNVHIPTPQEGVIEILDMKGNKIVSKQTDATDEDFQVTLSGNLQAGLYYVNYKTASGTTTQKFLKQ